MKRLFAASLLGTVMAVGPAAAQQFTNMIVYGDSLSDSGRLFAITGGTQPPSPPYFQGRFSNGQVWVERLAPALGFTFNPATNFAVGGAESGTGGPVGVATQVSALSATTPVSASTLVVVWAGANDILNRAATTPPTTLVPQIIGNIATAIGTVSARGGRTFLVGNLPDLGQTPGGRAGGAAQSTSLGGLTQIYNGALTTALTGLESARNVRIVVMNTFGLFNDVLANPSLYGIANTTVPCLTTAGPTGACATAQAAAAALFFDPIHPSATAHAVLANFAQATLNQDANGTRIAAVTSYLGPQILDTVRQGTNDRLNVLRLTNTKERSTLPSGVYGAVKYAKGERDDSAGVAGFEYDMLAYTIGYDHVIDSSFVLGAAATYLSGEAELDLARGEQEVDATAFSAYVGYRTNTLWLDLSGAGSWENYDLERATGFVQRPTALGDTSGNSFYVALDGGLDFVRDKSVMLGPFAGVRYLNADIDAYTETNAAMLSTAVAEQSNTGVIGSIGVQASGLFGSGNATVVPHIRVSYENELDVLDHGVAVTNAVGQIRTLSGGTGNDDYVLVGAGLNVQAGANFAFSLDYEGAVSRGDGKDHAVVGRLIYAF
jgi:outer membrane lipase/esterase